MAQQTDRVVPVKCTHCHRPMQTPLFCDYCETLNPAAGVADHFTLLGLPRRFDIDEKFLHERYVALSRHAHPDFHSQETPEVQDLSVTVSSALNAAYQTLSAPVRRAGYLLELLGGPASAEDKSVPDGFLETMMMMQEDVAEAVSGGDAGELARLREVLQTQQAGLMKRIAGLFAELAELAGCEALRQDKLGEIRRQLNAVAYVRKLLSQVAQTNQIGRDAFR